MERDSIIASPTYRVRVMVAEASGCCASAVSAVATDRPSPSAGAMHPMLIVRPAVTIEATAMRVMLSIVMSFVNFVGSFDGHRLAGARGGGDVNRGQDAEDVGLHHAGEQTKRRHHGRKDEWRDGQQNR